MVALVDEALGGTGEAELRLFYQPIVSLMGDSQENYSVLVRLLDREQRLHEAKAFLGALAAERMVELDRWVIKHAIGELVSQRTKGHRFNFFINIAEASLRDEELIAWLCDRLRDLDGRGNWLTFQLPEEEARGNLPALARLAEGLKKIKSRIALSRFGQGDDPQMLMERLPVDFVLFAHDLARGLIQDKAKQERLVALANLARQFNAKSIVTGVEDTHTLTVLWTAGIDYVQGNFLQRPSPSIEVQGPG
jgi:EAL domain-containing protein (putative c-di-GMP-specific phosphodiesterase class I)